MSAELVDPFATPTPERLNTSGMRADINARIALSSQNDPPLLPQLVQKTLEELTRAADDPVQDALSFWARWLLEQLHHRAVSGIPWGEAEEPAWAFDCPEPLYRHVLDADDLDPGEG